MSKLIAQQAQFGGPIKPVSPIYGQELAKDSPEALAPLKDFETIITTSIGILTVVASLFFVVYFFMAALKWTTAGGDSGKVGKARDEMVQGVMGLIVVVAAYGILGLVGTIIGINILNPAQTIFEALPGVGAG